VVSALYLPLMLCIAVFFGDTLDGRVGSWTWPFLLCVVVAIGFVRRQVFNFQEEAKPADGKRMSHVARRTVGMVAGGGRIPVGVFSLPLIANLIGLASRYRSLTLPTLANPCHPIGGIWGESKSGYLLDVAANARQWIADFVIVTRSAGPRTLFGDLERVRQSLLAAGLAFPLIAKTDLRRCRPCKMDASPALREHSRHFPSGEKLILQRFVSHSGEAAALYARLPGVRTGRVLSLSFRVGSHWHDASRHVTPELEARLDAIPCRMAD